MRFPTLPDGSIDEVRAEKLLNTAREAGVNYFDTAFPYHGGASEPFVGRVIAKWPRESFYLATKLPVWNCKTLDEAKTIFEQQFQRLGVDYIDFYLLHSLHKARYDAAKEMGIVDWLWEQKAAGRIRSFGFSCHDNAAGFEHILRDQPWDFSQLQYNEHATTGLKRSQVTGAPPSPKSGMSPSSSWNPSRAARWPSSRRMPLRRCAHWTPPPAPPRGRCAGWPAIKM